jgi:hypothetical protein
VPKVCPRAGHQPRLVTFNAASADEPAEYLEEGSSRKPHAACGGLGRHTPCCLAANVGGFGLASLQRSAFSACSGSIRRRGPGHAGPGYRLPAREASPRAERAVLCPMKDTVPTNHHARLSGLTAGAGTFWFRRWPSWPSTSSCGGTTGGRGRSRPPPPGPTRGTSRGSRLGSAVRAGTLPGASGLRRPCSHRCVIWSYLVLYTRG